MIKNKLYVYGEDNQLYVPIHLNFGKHMLNKCKIFKDRIAMIDSATDKMMTYSELAQLTVDIAVSLTRIGVGKGDVVGISTEERMEYMPTMLGLMCAGATFTNLGTTGAATLLHKAAMSKPKVVFCSADSYRTFRNTLDSVNSVQKYIVYDEDEVPGAERLQDFIQGNTSVDDFEVANIDVYRDVGWMMYSTGTTGPSKGVPWTHFNIFGAISLIVDSDYYCGKRALVVTDFYPVSLGCLHAGATLVLIHVNEADVIMETIERYKVQIGNVLPSTLHPMAYDVDPGRYDVSSLEHIQSASAPLRADLLRALKEKYPHIRNVCQFYGCTEIGPMCGTERSVVKPGSVGPPLPGVVAKVVDLDTREPVGAYRKGEICVKTPVNFPRYIGVDPPTHLDFEGFYMTGDIGYYDDDGHFFIVDRINDLIMYYDDTVSPADLEEVLMQHPEVREACVVGAPDPRLCELPTAFVVLRNGTRVTEKELADFVNDQVAVWMHLAGGVRFVDALPRGGQHKVDRKALRGILVSEAKEI